MNPRIAEVQPEQGEAYGATPVMSIGRSVYDSHMETRQFNPFSIGGEPPPYRAGHARVVDILGERLEQVRVDETGDTLIMCGPRGNGKTTLLGELWHRARAAGVLPCTLFPKSMRFGDGRLTGRLAIENRRAKGVRMLVGRAFGFRGGADFEPTGPVDILGALDCLLDRTPVLLLVDEAHKMPADCGGLFFQALGDCVLRGLPLLTVLAGSPGIDTGLSRMSDGSSDHCLRLPVGRLESDEVTREAFSIPAEQNGRPFDDDALGLLVAESQRHPYFVQVLGFESWKASVAAGNSRRISLADAEAGLVFADKERSRFYMERRDEIRRHKILPEAEAVSKAMVAKGTDPVLSDDELRRALEGAITSGKQSTIAAQRKIACLGLAWRETGDRWVPGIPSLCAYVARRSKD